MDNFDRLIATDVHWLVFWCRLSRWERSIYAYRELQWAF